MKKIIIALLTAAVVCTSAVALTACGSNNGASSAPQSSAAESKAESQSTTAVEINKTTGDFDIAPDALAEKIKAVDEALGDASIIKDMKTTVYAGQTTVKITFKNGGFAQINPDESTKMTHNIYATSEGNPSAALDKDIENFMNSAAAVVFGDKVSGYKPFEAESEGFAYEGTLTRTYRNSNKNITSLEFDVPTKN